MRPNLIKLLGLFLITVIVVGLLRAVQGLNAFGDLGVLIVLGVLLLPLTLIVFSLPTPTLILAGGVVAIWLLVMGLVTIDLINTFGFMTGMGYITTLHGPLLTIPLVLFLAVLLVPPLRMVVLRGLVAGGIAAVGAIIVTGIVRGLQHLDPAWDTNILALMAILAGAGGFLVGAGAVDPTRLFAGEPTFARGMSMAILGFLLGGLLVIVLRGLQSLDPLWDTGVGATVIAFSMAGFFLWGVGAFDPKMSEHGEHHAEEAHEIVEAPEEVVEEPGVLLGTQVWIVSFLVIVLMLFIAFVALVPGGPGLQITNAPDASFFAAGEVLVQLPFGGEQIVVSQLVVFFVFVIITLFSLALIGGAIGLLFFFLSRNITEVRNTKPTEAELTPPPAVQTVGRVSGSVAEWIRSGLPRLLGQR